MTGPSDQVAGPRPEIVCLCGSLRFTEQFHALERELALAGVIVLSPSYPAQAPDGVDVELSAEQRTTLGDLHLRKVELADRIIVVNPGGYLGESTRREIAHARAIGRPVSFTDSTGDQVTVPG